MATGQDVVDEVRALIHDEDSDSYRWTDAELLRYVNAAGRQIVTLVPEANVVEEIPDPDTDSARQTLPAGGIKFIRISCNVDSSDERQSPVRYAEKDALDTYLPAWESTAASDEDDYYVHYCHDKREPTVFYLYPKPISGRKAGVVFSKVPDDLASLSADIPLADEYYNAYVTYVQYRAMTKESRQTLPGALRKELWENFLSTLGFKRRADEMVSPEDGNVPPEAS